MAIILLGGTIFIIASGGGWFQVLLFWAICGMASNKFTDSNRRGKWWDDK